MVSIKATRPVLLPDERALKLIAKHAARDCPLCICRFRRRSSRALTRHNTSYRAILARGEPGVVLTPIQYLIRTSWNGANGVPIHAGQKAETMTSRSEVYVQWALKGHDHRRYILRRV